MHKPTELIDQCPAVCLGRVKTGHILLSEIIWRPLQVKFFLLHSEKECLIKRIFPTWHKQGNCATPHHCKTWA